ncbi:unnamed protein product [Pleuronectes platessa]|uniref:Uncharacterized protein n=1 Tax=Pleuronectes platessa TaxID=8262 RepID=A0A9N7VUN7_PLEPL|nr:unnamed protein product [Pleuronectes platessa]
MLREEVKSEICDAEDLDFVPQDQDGDVGESWNPALLHGGGSLDDTEDSSYMSSSQECSNAAVNKATLVFTSAECDGLRGTVRVSTEAQDSETPRPQVGAGGRLLWQQNHVSVHTNRSDWD